MIIILIRIENNNNISVSFSQVGIICAVGAALPKPELCCSFIALLYCMIGFEELLSHTGPSSLINDCYDIVCHILEYSYSEPISFDSDNASQRLLCHCKIGFEELLSPMGPSSAMRCNQTVTSTSISHNSFNRDSWNIWWPDVGICSAYYTLLHHMDQAATFTIKAI